MNPVLSERKEWFEVTSVLFFWVLYRRTWLSVVRECVGWAYESGDFFFVPLFFSRTKQLSRYIPGLSCCYRGAIDSGGKPGLTFNDWCLRRRILPGIA